MKKLLLVLVAAAAFVLAASPAYAGCQRCRIQFGSNEGICINVDSNHPNGREDCEDPCKRFGSFTCTYGGGPSSPYPLPPISDEGEVVGSVDVPMSLALVCTEYCEDDNYQHANGSVSAE